MTCQEIPIEMMHVHFQDNPLSHAIFPRGGVEGCETVSSIVVGEVAAGEIVAIGVCRDAMVRIWCCSRLQCVLHHNALENTAEAGRRLTPGGELTLSLPKLF